MKRHPLEINGCIWTVEEQEVEELLNSSEYKQYHDPDARWEAACEDGWRFDPIKNVFYKMYPSEEDEHDSAGMGI